VRLEEPDGKETEPLSPAAQPQAGEEGNTGKLVVRRRKFWMANAPWSIKKDGISAGLEFVRALIGYILCVAGEAFIEVDVLLTREQHVSGHDIQHWVPVRSYWKRAIRGAGVWKIYERLNELG
jgi:cation transport regulator ChaC